MNGGLAVHPVTLMLLSGQEQTQGDFGRAASSMRLLLQRIDQLPEAVGDHRELRLPYPLLVIDGLRHGKYLGVHFFCWIDEVGLELVVGDLDLVDLAIVLAHLSVNFCKECRAH